MAGIVLGISALFHDSSAAIVRDGTIVVAAQEERFSRRKHDAGWPNRARLGRQHRGVVGCRL